MPFPADQPVVLWRLTDGLCCSFARRPSTPAFEITIARDAETIARRAFENDVDAAAFAIDEMHKHDRLAD